LSCIGEEFFVKVRSGIVRDRRRGYGFIREVGFRGRKLLRQK
jgi:hypothetical protein